MTIGGCIGAGILLFMTAHFGIIAVYTIKIERSIIFGILAVSAFVLAIAMIHDFGGTSREYLLLTVIAGINIAGFRYRVFKTFGVRHFRIGRWWYLAPFAVEAAALAVLAALYANPVWRRSFF